MSTDILGISAFYHDSAACLVRDGHIVAAAQEERFTRKKFDARFPTHAVRYCLQEGRISLSDLKYFVFYDKPLVKFERLLETYVAFSPKGVKSFLAAMPVWLKEKLLLKSVLQDELVSLDGVKKSGLPPILFGEHHESHAASAFYPSPFKSAVVLCMDGVGEWATTSAWFGEGNKLSPLGKFISRIRSGCCIPHLLTTPDSGSIRVNIRSWASLPTVSRNSSRQFTII